MDKHDKNARLLWSKSCYTKEIKNTSILHHVTWVYKWLIFATKIYFGFKTQHCNSKVVNLLIYFWSMNIYFQFLCMFLIAPILAPPTTTTQKPDPCRTSPCGLNAICTNQNGIPNCRCLPDYFGDPYLACTRECNVHSDCSINKACKDYHCIDPCPGLCGVNAQCRVINHIPTCTCEEGYVGDPFSSCRLRPISKKCLI